jgi:predicted DNA binding protein
MTHYEVAFRLQHECPYNTFSRKHPAAVISHWCNWNRDILEISHQDLQNSEIQSSIQELTKTLGTRIIRRSFTKSNIQVVLQRCACYNVPPPTLPTIERRNCLDLQPAVYTDGWEWYRVIAFSDRDVKDLFSDLKGCRVEVTSRKTVEDESVRDTFLVSSVSLFGALTEKQRKALITALDNGYYRIPRTATAGEIAERLGLPRTSFVDHLRKAENKIILASGPYLRLQQGLWKQTPDTCQPSTYPIQLSKEKMK